MKQGKDWGEKIEIFNNGVISIDLLTIKKGGYCSEHHHLGKSNIFHVIEGDLEITIFRERDWPGVIDSPDRIILRDGESTEIRPMAYDPEKPELVIEESPDQIMESTPPIMEEISQAQIDARLKATVSEIETPEIEIVQGFDRSNVEHYIT